jgi:hypothetical protein
MTYMHACKQDISNTDETNNVAFLRVASLYVYGADTRTNNSFDPRFLAVKAYCTRGVIRHTELRTV